MPGAAVPRGSNAADIEQAAPHPRRAVRILIRPPARTDAREFLAGVRRSGALHRHWVTAPDSAARFRAWIRRMQPPAHHAFLVCRREDGAIVGVVNLTNVVLGLFRSGHLGYYAFAGFERRGYMREGLNAVVRHAFTALRLHRVEANIQPGNAASLALAAACGFAREGYSPRYLKVGGRWRDHERWARLAS